MSGKLRCLCILYSKNIEIILNVRQLGSDDCGVFSRVCCITIHDMLRRAPYCTTSLQTELDSIYTI